MRYFPVNMDIQGKKCIVVGGGNVAHRKVASLLRAGALVRIIAPDLKEEMTQLVEANRLAWTPRRYRKGDLKGASLAFVAVDSRQVSKRAAEEARQLGIPVNVADVPALCSFTLPSLTEREDLLITVSTGGKCPALSKAVRLRIEETIDAPYGVLLQLLADLRKRLTAQGLETNKCRDLLNKLINSDILQVLRAGKLDEALAMIESILPASAERGSGTDNNRSEKTE